MGWQAITMPWVGKSRPATRREYGVAEIETTIDNPLMPTGTRKVWMSHGDRIDQPPQGFTVLARSDHSPVAAICDLSRNYYGVQFHPEVRHTPRGEEILRRFVVDICRCKPEWTPESIIQQSIARIQQQVGDRAVLSAISGGVDSAVATALVQRAIGDQLTAIFVDTGLLRQGEAAQVQSALQKSLGVELVVVDAVDVFLQALHGVSEPEEKRRIIGELFIRTFEQHARQLGQPQFLVQGTIYPDVVESSAPDRNKAHRIKTHHNVGGLPSDLNFELVEPLALSLQRRSTSGG
jgi:GMP synthase (glutamine-hydrolysing)